MDVMEMIEHSINAAKDYSLIPAHFDSGIPDKISARLEDIRAVIASSDYLKLDDIRKKSLMLEEKALTEALSVYIPSKGLTLH